MEDGIIFKGRSYNNEDFEKILDRIEKDNKQYYKSILKEIETKKQKELSEKFGDSEDRTVQIGNVIIIKRFKKSGEPYFIWDDEPKSMFGEDY